MPHRGAAESDRPCIDPTSALLPYRERASPPLASWGSVSDPSACRPVVADGQLGDFLDGPLNEVVFHRSFVGGVYNLLVNRRYDIWITTFGVGFVCVCTPAVIEEGTQVAQLLLHLVLVAFETRLAVLVDVLTQRCFDVSADLAVFLPFDVFNPVDEPRPHLIVTPNRVRTAIAHAATPPVHETCTLRLHTRYVSRMYVCM